MQHKGTDMSLPVGAVLKRVYWTVPTHYTIGSEHADHAEALAQGIENLEALIAQHERFYAADTGDVSRLSNYLPLPEHITIIKRWDFRWEASASTFGGGIDGEAERFTYETLAEAKEALQRMQKFSPIGRMGL